jgi:hypothetical protein
MANFNFFLLKNKKEGDGGQLFAPHQSFFYFKSHSIRTCTYLKMLFYSHEIKAEIGRISPKIAFPLPHMAIVDFLKNEICIYKQ